MDSVLYQVTPAVGADGKGIMKLIPVQRSDRQPPPAQQDVQRSNGQLLGQSYLTQTHAQVISGQSFPTQTPVLRTNGVSHPTLMPVQLLSAQFFPTQTPVQSYPIQTPVQIINGQSVPMQMPFQRTDGQSYLTAVPQKVFTVFKPLLQSASPPFVSPLNVLTGKMDSLKTQSLQQQTEARIPQTGSPSVGGSSEIPASETSPALRKSEVPNFPTEAHAPSVYSSKHQPVVKDQTFSPSASFSAKRSSPIVIYLSPDSTENPEVALGSAADRLRELAVMVNTCDSLCKSAGSEPFTCDAPLKKGPAPKLKLIPKASGRPCSPTRWVIEEIGSCLAKGPSIKLPPSESAHFSKKQDVPNQTLPENPNPWVVYDGRMFYGTKAGRSSSKPPTATQSLPPSSFSSLQQPVGSAGSLTNEVIDLCDDDCSPSSNMSSVYCEEEDHVIFVSYVPPKSKSGSGLKDGLGSGSSSSRTNAAAGRDTGRVQSPSISLNGSGPAEGVIVESLNPKCLIGTTKQCPDNLEMDTEAGSSGSPSKEEHPATVQNSELPVPAGTSSSAPETCPKSDHQLRNIFGITADVKICLQKIDEMPHWCVSASVVQTTSRGPVDGSDLSRDVLKAKEVSLQDFPSPDKLDDNVRTEREHSPSPHSRTLRSPCVSKENCCSFSPQAKPVFGYVEPIDEDFPDENDLPQLQDTPVHPQTQTCVEVTANTRRMGRTRKRTMCLCCVPPTLLPVIKSGTRLEELEMWMSAIEPASKRVGRTKAARKTSTRISHPNCRVHKPPAGSDPSTVPEGLKRHEQIKKHNEHQAKKLHK
ncbi:uncharacterized protein lrif1 isoform X2 [Xiphophorus hellerii]|uniref:uncharacterized protein lrif1 isoform X2 n=1 Tax=Xiphophorus hellerii TaxID=8084 RepID=UPI0013B3E52E|nr:uncharacterized protein LOC116720975 isoform X2 [Xiphophorus hellerii]